MLKVYNTLTKNKEEFVPLHPPFVGMYVCGPTVYDDPHLGHAKSYVSFDVIVRFLRASDYKVRYVQNITDVGHLLGDLDEGEDRIQKKAKLERLEPIEIAQKYENHFFRDMDRLNCLRPDISCRATGHIPEMIELVEVLLKKGYAYKVKGNVYFSVSKFKEYGKLSRRKVVELKDGTRVKTTKDKRDPADFALWKEADGQHLMQWPSPWGRGFPGWHLECSVMSMKYIGESIDIHGGGIDNQFPHHECEIAQSESATGQPFAKYWLHNNMVTIDGQKMSKSLGNFVTVEELFKKYDPMVIRFFILQGHYRSPQDFSEEALDGAKKGFDKLIRTAKQIGSMVPSIGEKQNLSSKWAGYKDRFFEFMDDDFNTAGAITVLFDLSKETYELLSASKMNDDDLSAVNILFHLLGEQILGFNFPRNENQGLELELIELLIQLRDKFREKKDWSTSDEIRKGLEAAGIIIEDGKDGTQWRRK